MSQSKQLPEARELIAQVSQRLQTTAETVVPWFLQSMPLRYWHDTDAATRQSHLTAIIAARASSVPLRLHLKNADESEWTVIHDQDYPGLLAELLRQLPTGRELRAARIHTAEDSGLVVDVFRFATPSSSQPEPSPAADDQRRQEAQAAAALRAAILDEVLAAAKDLPVSPAKGLSLPDFVAACAPAYLRTLPPRRIVSAWQQCRTLFGSDDTAVTMEPDLDEERDFRISVALGGTALKELFVSVTGYLAERKLNIRRAYVDVFETSDGRAVSQLSYIVRPAGGELPLHLWEELRHDLLRMRWLDDRVLDLASRHPGVGIEAAEILVALGHLVHTALSRENSYAFAYERILQVCERHLAISAAVAERVKSATRAAAQPGTGRHSGTLFLVAGDLLGQIEREIDEPVSRRILSELVSAAGAIRATNLLMDNRYALGIRCDPAYFDRPDRSESPYAVFFVHGRGFVGFHVRFRDIARGGMRVVRPAGPEQHALELERIYDEAYGLAFAQQLKNKDIPEGGAKAVVLMHPHAPVERGVKAFTNSLLDLVYVSPSQAQTQTQEPYGERLYLGPDENISIDLIEWIVARARERGYPVPSAFMSSKPGAGINHKEYGVTSEGLTVFLEEALREIGIDPRAQRFTVKLTGGPDGDVAGNQIKILYREFGERARIVGIADGSGCAEDPDGLDYGELLRLCAAELPIAHFHPGRLGPRGELVTLDQPDGKRRRNTMHNRVLADAFVPAGGRPETIHQRNWREFLQSGRPSSRIIVEGANLFLTPEARMALSTEAGVLIIKDSSANKCGVICSSFEIVASMLLSEEEFLAVKERFVAEVIERLRDLARREAKLLFRERRHNPNAALPELSIHISRVILRTADAIERALPAMDEADRGRLGILVAEHLPAVLVERAGHRMAEALPPSYWNGMVAAILATKIVYREGLSYLAHMDTSALVDLAFRYLRQEEETSRLCAEVAASGLPDRERIVELLRQGGSRAGLMTR